MLLTLGAWRPSGGGPRVPCWRDWSRRSKFSQRGMVTAEFAVVLPAVVLVLAFSLGALGLAWDQIRCVDAARAGARAASRGDSAGAVILVVSRAAPTDAVVSVSSADDIVSVSVASGPRVAAGLLPAWLRASSTAYAARESSDPPQ